jgi:hypothetical protein
MYLVLPLDLVWVYSTLGATTDAPSLSSMVKCLYKNDSFQNTQYSSLGAEPHFPGSRWGFVVSLHIQADNNKYSWLYFTPHPY